MLLNCTLEDRFWQKVDKLSGEFGIDDSFETECWCWTASLNKGYGVICTHGRNDGYHKAHRVSWVLHFGPIPDDILVLHECDNRRCVRPDHLFLGTQKDNLRDAINKGRFRGGFNMNPAKGSDNIKAKLTQQEVDDIRELYSTGILQKDLASRFNVSQSTISSIVRRDTWL